MSVRVSRRHPAAVLTLAAVALLCFSAGALAAFDGTGTVGANTFNADTLSPPTSLMATGGTSVTLSWTATADIYATGHRVFRGTVDGGPYSQVAEVTPRTNTAYVESPPDGIYYYVVRSFVQNWQSANSNQASATVATGTNTGFLSCATNAPVTIGSGDNNGYQLTPNNACANGSGYAQDTNSGTNTVLSCTGTGKDRHLFYDFGFAIPAGSTIDGIEVRLDAHADGTSGTPTMCVELSWNGGLTWTATKSTPTLTVGETTYTLGTPTDTWGHSWAIADFTNANFRLRVTDVSSNSGRDFRLDWVAVQVTYSAP